MAYEAIILPITTAIIAGLGWSTIGIWAEWRSGNKVAIDIGKLKKNVIVGAVVGAVSWGYVISQGDVVPLINSVETFIAAIVGYFPIIVVVDKLLVKKATSKTK